MSKEPLPTQLKGVSDLLNESLKLLDRAIDDAEESQLDLFCWCMNIIPVQDVNKGRCSQCDKSITVYIGEDNE